MRSTWRRRQCKDVVSGRGELRDASAASVGVAGAVPQLDNGAHSYLPRVPDNNSGLGAATTPAASRTAPTVTPVSSSASTAASSTHHRVPHTTTTAALARRSSPRPPHHNRLVSGDGALHPPWRKRVRYWRKRVRYGFG